MPNWRDRKHVEQAVDESKKLSVGDAITQVVPQPVNLVKEEKPEPPKDEHEEILSSLYVKLHGTVDEWLLTVHSTNKALEKRDSYSYKSNLDYWGNRQKRFNAYDWSEEEVADEAQQLLRTYQEQYRRVHTSRDIWPED